MLYLEETKEKGKGVFTDSKIKKGQTILVFKGEVLNDEQLEETKNTKDPRVYDYSMQISPTTYFYASQGIGKFVNHSCEPNSGVKANNNVKLIAIKGIREGEEVCFDYATVTENGSHLGTNSWERIQKYFMGGGSSNLRHIIRFNEGLVNKKFLYKRDVLDYLEQYKSVKIPFKGPWSSG